MIGVRLGVGHHFSGGFDSSASAFFTATGITGATEQQAVNTLVTSLKSAGLWSKMKAVYPFVTDNRNLLSYTEDFGNGYWGKLNATITTNSITAPNGTLTADTFTGSNATSYIYTNTPISSVGNNTFSIYVKAGSLSSFSLDFASSGLSYGGTSIINLTTGTAGVITYYGGASGWTVTVESVNNGWYRCTIGGNIATTQNMFCEILAASGTLYLWGAQLEKSSTATTYQPIATTQQSYISSQFKYNLVNPVDSDAAFRLVFNGGWTMSNQGATPNGTNGYADTKYNPNVNGQLNSAHLSYYSRTNVSLNQVEMGTYGLAANGHYLLYNFSGTTYASINDIEAASNTITNTTGFLLGQRVDSSTLKYFLRGSLLQTITRASTTRPNTNIVIGAYNLSNNVPNLFSTKQCAFSSIGDGLSDSEATAFYNAVQTFQTTLNRQIAP